MEEELIPLRKAAMMCNVTKQALYVAFKKRGLKAIMMNKRIFVTEKALYDYQLNKYNSDLRKFEGEYVFDLTKGHFSIHQVLRALSEELKRPYPKQRIYYFLRTGQLKGFRKGNAWIVMQESAVELLQKELLNQQEEREMMNGR